MSTVYICTSSTRRLLLCSHEGQLGCVCLSTLFPCDSYQSMRNTALLTKWNTHLATASLLLQIATCFHSSSIEYWRHWCGENLGYNCGETALDINQVTPIVRFSLSGPYPGGRRFWRTPYFIGRLNFLQQASFKLISICTNFLFSLFNKVIFAFQ